MWVAKPTLNNNKKEKELPYFFEIPVYEIFSTRYLITVDLVYKEDEGTATFPECCVKNYVLG